MRKHRTAHYAVDISEDRGVRYLHIGSDWIQGAMRIARPHALELTYTREMMFGLLLTPPSEWPRQLLQIGLGAGSLARYIHRHLPQARQTIAEINPQVEMVARQCFKLPDDPRRLRVHLGCGGEYLLASDKMFDWIMVDGFDTEGRMGLLETLPFLQLARTRLNSPGLFCVNLLGRDRGFGEIVSRLRQAFAEQVLVLPACESGNVIVFAHAGSINQYSWTELAERAEALAETTGLDLRPSLQRLQASRGGHHLNF